VSPSSGTTGGGTAVTLTGTNLSGATGVSFGGAAAKVTADSGTQITVTSPSGTGTVNITVTTPGGSASAGTFTYMTPAPAVTGLSPSSGTTAGGTAVTISGTNLSGATGVSFGGTAAKVTADSNTQIAVISPAGTGTVNVTVTTPGGSAAAGRFTYVTPPPAISAISPSSGTTDGGTTVTITGTNLTGATSVSFGGAAGRIISDSGTQITVTSPGGKGTVNITVTTAAGTSAVTAACQYTYMAPVLN
jgi:large repetitive protein